MSPDPVIVPPYPLAAPQLGDLELFLSWLAAHEDLPYLWGGRGTRCSIAPNVPGMWPDGDGLWPSPYEGWDCWGLVADGLLAAGGPDLRRWWTDHAWAELPAVATPAPGDLVFYAPREAKDPNDVEHVEVVVGRGAPLVLDRDEALPGWRTIGARGGNHRTTSLAMAASQKASVRFRDNHLQRPRVAGFRRLPLLRSP